MKYPAVSLVITVKNEAHTIQSVLESIVAQTVLPDEVIVLDGGSEDDTFSILRRFSEAAPAMKWHIFQQASNRSKGRNSAISSAQNEWIAITDAGCVLDKKWLEELVKTQQQSGAPVVAGYYKGMATTPFEEAVIPYTLVMPDRVDENSFLPATRSMLLHVSVWKKLGGFPKQIEVGEDYYFAKKIKQSGFEIAFARDAIVGWRPRSDLGSFFKMVQAMAAGDAFSGEVRRKVKLIFVRYGIAGLLLLIALSTGSGFLMFVLLAGGMLYIIWAILKNKRYVKHGWKWLPVLQFVSDAGVILGTLEGAAHHRIGVED